MSRCLCLRFPSLLRINSCLSLRTNLCINSHINSRFDSLTNASMVSMIHRLDELHCAF